MRSGLGIAAIAVVLITACSDAGSARLASEWGCGPVEGLAAISGDRAPDWLLVGEFTETSEAPAAIAEIACHLASDGRPLFVGIPEYAGGATDAEDAMRERLGALIAKGAPLIVESIGEEDHPYTLRHKDRVEKAWAEALTARVAAAGASRALLFLPHASAIAERVAPIGDRFAGYTPMPVFLKGDIVSLEIAPSPAVGLPGPAIRIHRAMMNGFHGQLALNRMTRPGIDIPLPPPQAVAEARPDLAESAGRDARLDAEIQREALEQARDYLDIGEVDLAPLPGDMRLEPELDLPDFEAE
ncbi:MAG: hypothetical protein RIR33_3689 [Pseudomonadota bacterium]|jgi:hypothetical protein